MGGIVTRIRTPRASQQEIVPTNTTDAIVQPHKNEKKPRSSVAASFKIKKTAVEFPINVVEVTSNQNKSENNNEAHSSWKKKAKPERFRTVHKKFKGFRVTLYSNETADTDFDFFGQTEKSKMIKQESEKKAVIANLSSLALMNKDDLNWLVDEMIEADVPADQFLYREGQNCPFFIVTVTGKFILQRAGHGEDNAKECVKYANAGALLGHSKCTETLLCTESGKIWYISRLSYQKQMIDRLKRRTIEGESLLNNITEVPGLKELPKSQREQIANALREVHFIKGEILMEQGQEGHTMFFIQSGELIITKAKLKNFLLKKTETIESCVPSNSCIDIDSLVSHQNGSMVIATRSAGEYIGEGALLESLYGSTGPVGTRNANVVASTDARCLALDRKDFEAHMGSLKELLEHNFCVRILKSLELMSSLNESELMTIASMLEECMFAKGEIVVNQGDQGDEFYIVKDGMLECTLDDDGKATAIGTLVSGDYFGEGALLTNEPRRCNIAVVGDAPASLWVLHRRNFESCLSEVVKENLGKTFSARREASSVVDSEKTPRDNVSFDDLAVSRTLGSGSYGTVDLVRNKITGQPAALKRIRKSTVLAKKQQRFIQNERGLLAEMKSPFIINLIRTFKTDDSVYMLMDLCLGGELYNFMKEVVDKRLAAAGLQDESAIDSFEDGGVVGCFDIPIQTRFFAACIILGIEYIHGQGIIHRDIKPENLMLSPNGYLKLVDFGFAKKVFDQRTYSLCGTPEYTAPEVFKRIGHGKQVDFWALGVILYEMASGFSPFHVESQNSWDCFVEISKYEKFYPHIQFPTLFKKDLVDLLLALMHPNPLNRFGTLKMSAKELKNHPFFGEFEEHEKVDWGAIESLNYVLPTEFLPAQPEFGLDTRNFEECLDRHQFTENEETADLVKNDFSSWDNEF